MSDSKILAVEEAAARLGPSGPGCESAPASLQCAIAAAIAQGKSIRDVAAAAHLTALEVLDAADAVTYAGPSAQPLHMTR